MQNTFQFKDKTVSVITDFIDDETHWFVRYTDADGLLNEYRIKGYPDIPGKVIIVSYSWVLKRTSNGEILKSYADTYKEYRVSYFYNAVLPTGITYGHFAAIQSINGLIARLGEFDGSKENPDAGYRVFDQSGNFFQPIVFDITNVQQETVTSDGSGNVTGNSDGSFQVVVHNGSGVYEYSMDGITYYDIAPTSGLAAGKYTIYVRDQAGVVRYRTVVIPQQTLDLV